MSVDLSRASWRKSSRSDAGSGGNCVEVALAVDATAVRDSKEPNGPALVFGRARWQDFLTSARNGTLD